MSLISQAQRVAHRNPVHPYAWEARYRPAGRLRQFDLDGPHTSLDIDRRRLRSLVILGHPASPIELALPYPPPPDGPLVEHVVIQATTDLSDTVELGTGERQRDVVTWCFFGFQYEAGEAHVVQLDPAGHLLAVVTDVVAPIDCPRCGPRPGTRPGFLVPLP